jgi:competence protein ComFC
MNNWKRWVNKALDILYPSPPVCLLCERPVLNHINQRGKSNEQLLCTFCEKQFDFIVDRICLVCGRPWVTEEMCGDCTRRKERYFLYSRSAVRYNDAMKKLLAQYKYRGDRKLADLLALFLLRAWQLHYSDVKIHFLTYIPLHEERLFERTFNQAEEIAHLLGKEIKIPVYGVLERQKATEKQSKKNRVHRLKALENVFSFSFDRENELPEQPGVLLIDDVYTTGTTMVEAGHAIKIGIPEARIYGLTVAR